MRKQHITLTEEHQTYLRELTSKGVLPAKTMKRAIALLELQDGKTFQQLAQSLNLSYNTVSIWATNYRTDQRRFLQDAPRSGRPLDISGESRAKVTALACSPAPDGRSQWSLRLLANKAVELGYCEHLSHNQAGVILKKTKLNLI